MTEDQKDEIVLIQKELVDLMEKIVNMYDDVEGNELSCLVNASMEMRNAYLFLRESMK